VSADDTTGRYAGSIICTKSKQAETRLSAAFIGGLCGVQGNMLEYNARSSKWGIE
jgi:hypothetical protein